MIRIFPFGQGHYAVCNWSFKYSPLSRASEGDAAVPLQPSGIWRLLHDYIMLGPILVTGALQNEDGGWGLHIEGHSTMFCTVLTYVTLRLLGEGPDGGNGAIARGRQWILDHGSATATTSWGKVWLSV